MISIGVLIGILLINSSIQAKMYRWTDKDGKVHYSQSIPPSQAHLGHHELSEKNGMMVKKVESEKIKGQRNREKEKLKAEQLENQKALREELVVYMFASKSELSHHFKERLKMISVNIRLLIYHQKKLLNNIKDSEKSLAKSKNKNRKKELTANLNKLKRTLNDHSQAIKTNVAERTEVNEQMVRAIDTYEKKFGNSQLIIGSLIGKSALKEFRGKMISSVRTANGMCSCPCDTTSSAANTEKKDTKTKI